MEKYTFKKLRDEIIKAQTEEELEQLSDIADEMQLCGRLSDEQVQYLDALFAGELSIA